MDAFDLRFWPGFAQAGGDLSQPAIIDQIAIDSRRIDTGHALFVPLEGQKENGHRFICQALQSGALFSLAKKGWSKTEGTASTRLLFVEDPLRAFQEIAASYRKHLDCTVIGIAGSYGKTMVKDLLQDMISAKFSVAASPESFNSQIGVPLSLLTITKEHKIALIEAGVSYNDEMDVLQRMIAPDHGILTHIGKKHIATLGDLDNIASETLKLFHQIPSANWMILPTDPLLKPHLRSLSAMQYFWGSQIPSLPQGSFAAHELGDKMSYHVNYPDGFQFSGSITSGFYYFLDLINITAKAAWLLGISSNAISAALQDYIPAPMRTEIWKSPIGATFINDTYCSDPQSIDLALQYFQQAPIDSRKVFAFGGMRSKQNRLETDYRRIGKAINKASIKTLILFGKHHFEPLIEEVRKQSPQTEISLHPGIQEAFEQIKSQIRQDDVVLIKGERKESFDRLTEIFHDSICNNQCLINLAAIKANISAIRKKLPKETRMMVMVKAFAYGTDEVRMAKFLETCGVDILGISYVDEGVALKRAGVNQSLFVINAAVYEAAKVVKWDLEIGVSETDLIEAVACEAMRQNKKIKVHLHVDTGMGRFGCRADEALALAQQIMNCPNLVLEGIMTHFACADNPEDDAFTRRQVQKFDSVIEKLKHSGIEPRWKHAANSSGVLRFHLPQYNMVRIGLAVYGLYPSKSDKHSIDLRMALSLLSRIVGINYCKSGDTISYGRSYSVQRETQRIAVLPIGYFDGLHRNYSGKSYVIIRGQKAPMVGNICMDFMMVDITDIPNASIGDSVLIFGEDEYGHYLSPEDLATSGDSIVYELITCLGPRIQRIFIYEENFFGAENEKSTNRL